MSIIQELYPEISMSEPPKSWGERVKNRILRDQTWESIVTIGWTIVLLLTFFLFVFLLFWSLVILVLWAVIIRELGMSRHKYTLKYYKYKYAKFRIWEDEQYNYETFIAYRSNQVFPLKMSKADRLHIYTKTEHTGRLRTLLKKTLAERKQEIEEKTIKRREALEESNIKKLANINREKLEPEEDEDIKKIEYSAEKLQKHLSNAEDEETKCKHKISAYKEKLSGDINAGKRNKYKAKIKKYKEKLDEIQKAIEVIKQQLLEVHEKDENLADDIESEVEKEIEEEKKETEEKVEREKEEGSKKEEEKILTSEEIIIRNIEEEDIDEYDDAKILDLYDILFGSSYPYLIKVYYSDTIANDWIIVISNFTFSETFNENEKMCMCEGFWFDHKRSDLSVLEAGKFYDVPLLYVTECSASIANIELSKKKREVLDNDISEAIIGYVLRKLSNISAEYQTTKHQKEALEFERNVFKKSSKLIMKRWKTEELDDKIQKEISPETTPEQTQLVGEPPKRWGIAKYLCLIFLFIFVVYIFYINTLPPTQ